MALKFMDKKDEPIKRELWECPFCFFRFWVILPEVGEAVSCPKCGEIIEPKDGRG